MVTVKRKTSESERLCKALGERIYLWREGKKWSQQDLADQAGIDRAYVSRIEAGLVEVCLGTQQKLAAAFDKTISELFEGLQ